jgi:hypothetical protein
MGERANKIAGQFEAAVADFAEAIKSLPDNKWSAAVTEEGWTVGQAAEHVAGQFPLEMEFITAAAEGRPLPSYNWDDINGMNDGRADRNKDATKDQVLATLEDGAASVAAYIRGLDDAQLDRTGKLALANGAEVSTQQLLEGGVLIDHVNGHLNNIRAAL